MAGPGRDDDHDEEVRFAVVLNGGVSLAIWMGGVTYEIDRLTRTWPGADSVYGRLLDLVQARARADVIAGTSAGGINGAFLALGQAYEYAQLPILRV
jgi:predicted acylesterase/phospholipase RssA